MKLSTSTAILHPSTLKENSIDIRTIPFLLKEAGFESVDWSVWNFCLQGGKVFDGLLNEDNWQDQIKELAEADEKAGIPCDQTHCVSVNSAGYQRLDKAHLRTLEERCLISSAMLGAKWMVIHPFENAEIENRDFETNCAFFYEYLKPLIELAHRFQVGIAVENMIQRPDLTPRRFCADASQLHDFVAYVNDPLVGCCWDTGHGHLSGQNQRDSLLLLAPYLHATHIDDNFGNDYDAHLLPLEGKIDWCGVLETLKELNYQDAFAFEHALNPMPKEIIPLQLRYMASLGKQLLA